MKTLLIASTPLELKKISKWFDKETATVTVPKINSLNMDFEWDIIYFYKVAPDVRRHLTKTLKSDVYGTIVTNRNDVPIVIV